MDTRLSLAALALALTAAPAAAQGGWRTEEIPELGIEYKCARDYEAVPTQPTEQWIIAQWIEKVPRDEDDRKPIRPSLDIVWIDWVPEPGPTTGVGSEPPPPPGEDGDGEGDDGGAADDAPPEPPPKPINSLTRYVERRMPSWTLGAPTPGDEQDGNAANEYELKPAKPGTKERRWAYEFKNEKKRTVAFVGSCHEDDWDDQARIWRYMVRKTRFSEPESANMEKWERYYERRPQYVDPAYRLKVRSQLVRGWDADDTENYIFVFSTKDQPLLRILARELEAIREAYVELFPPVAPVTAVSTVRVCKDRDEYFAYGGPRGSGGYWNSATEELVFYDYDSLDQPGKERKGKENTRIVLYHEAFHQYIHYSTGELPPHSWFNEGTGDFFSGALISGGRVKKIDVNPWRIARVQADIEAGRSVPWSEIVAFEQPEYYRRDRVGTCYAQGWSMIYFLRTSRDVERRPEWAKILPTYFDVLKAEYGAEVEKLGEEPTPQARWEAGKRAREAALKAAFEDVDFLEIEQAWKEYTLDLDVPR